MNKKYVFLPVSAGALIVAGVCTANFLANRAVPEFTYNEPSETLSAPVVTDDDSEANTTPPETTEDIPAESGKAPSAKTEKAMLCGDPQHSIYAEYDGAVLTVSGTCPETMSISALLASDTAQIPDEIRNGSEYTLKFNTQNKAGDVIELEMFFGDGSGLVYDYKFYTDGTSIIEGDFSAVREINEASLDNATELSAEYTAEYILPDGTAEQRAEILSQVRGLSDRICEGITDDYDKARALAEWVSVNIYYDFDARHDSVDMETVSLSHVLETHRTVCIGFANLYTALCSAQDITCYSVNGDALRGEFDYAKRLEHTALHEWNIVVIDGRKINVDTVWDTTNAYSGGQYNQGEVYGKFFDAGDILFSQGHRARKTELRDYFGQ